MGKFKIGVAHEEPQTPVLLDDFVKQNPNGKLSYRVVRSKGISGNAQSAPEPIDRAMEIAKAAQETIGEAYRSPFTLNAAYEAARIALEQMTTEQGEQ